ncbi:hypothetical protein [Selenomonas ruminantium]|uniref:Uncharacterized protein n=1 Tax=Selenomonas ruminantium TaxID=971 RepID=A0A1K1NKR9_SELRU|nr:hypothetical protein [Selenomonas ruminantium]SFW36074.1 hypothetical protein SAMN02910323_1464 [Selenomonas ruminantium]
MSIEAKEAKLVSNWRKLRRYAGQFGTADDIVSAARQDLVTAFGCMTEADDLAGKAVLVRAAASFGAEMPEKATAPDWELGSLLAGQLDVPGQEQLHYEAEEVALAFLHVLREAAQAALSCSVTAVAMYDKGNALLQAAEAAFAAEGLEVSFRALSMPSSVQWQRDVQHVSEQWPELKIQQSSGMMETELPASETSVPAEPETDWGSLYLHESKDLESGLVERCHRAGLHLTEEAVHVLHYSAGMAFTEPGIKDGRLVMFLFGRAVRHQAERLQGGAGAIDELVASDWESAFAGIGI